MISFYFELHWMQEKNHFKSNQNHHSCLRYFRFFFVLLSSRYLSQAKLQNFNLINEESQKNKRGLAWDPSFKWQFWAAFYRKNSQIVLAATVFVCVCSFPDIKQQKRSWWLFVFFLFLLLTQFLFLYFYFVQLLNNCYFQFLSFSSLFLYFFLPLVNYQQQINQPQNHNNDDYQYS